MPADRSALPVGLSIDTNGEVSFSAGAEWVTQIGTFGIGADLDPPSDDTTQLVIAHPRASGQAVQDRYSISSTDTLGTPGGRPASTAASPKT